MRPGDRISHAEVPSKQYLTEIEGLGTKFVTLIDMENYEKFYYRYH